MAEMIISPRRTGKSTEIASKISQHLLTGGIVVLQTPAYRMSRELVGCYHFRGSRNLHLIQSSHKFEEFMRGKNFDFQQRVKVFVDEFDFVHDLIVYQDAFYIGTLKKNRSIEDYALWKLGNRDNFFDALQVSGWSYTKKMNPVFRENLECDFKLYRALIESNFSNEILGL
jgi:hypothetical protein